MKLIVFGLNWVFILGVFFILLLLQGCQGEELPEGEVFLSQISNNQDYSSLPLISTKWKLIGFVDATRNTIKLAEDSQERSFTLTFKEDGVLEGFTSSNIVWREYVLLPPLEANKIDLSLFAPSTYAGETPDGYLYIELMKKVYLYQISTKGLALFHDPRKYLLFKPVD
ncbi:hypothetical protein [Lunatibacter salilacus]|uniref:hypothetical protein n=1 Tax=Lunatibacter salilacus TaxID=2483804 RepID=UPI00131B297F|nr:hypothetical protein [Lunatibacter salilacus]